MIAAVTTSASFREPSFSVLILSHSYKLSFVDIYMYQSMKNLLVMLLFIKLTW